MDVLLVRVATEDELELRCGHLIADNVNDVVTDNPFSSGKVTNAHFNDPALDV